MEVLKLLSGGLHSTIQDEGRIGFQRFGISESGAVDQYSYYYSNLLVKNPINEAVIETAFMGLKLEVLDNVTIAVTGGDMKPTINEQPLPMWQTVNVTKGDIITFHQCASGFRSYLSVQGGINVPVVLGSKSTYLAGGIGGIDGRLLKPGDVIRGENHTTLPTTRRVKEQFISKFAKEVTLRVILGPQNDYFTEKGIDTFLTATYIVSDKLDRMGCRLEGPQIVHKENADIISDGIPLGGIQVPKHGNPIIMLKDRQSIGGYTKIGVVCSADMYKAGQLSPGINVKFQAIAWEDAIEEYKRFRASISEENIQEVIINKRYYNIAVNGNRYQVEVQQIGGEACE